jgi:hypothetical protein
MKKTKKKIEATHPISKMTDRKNRQWKYVQYVLVYNEGTVTSFVEKLTSKKPITLEDAIKFYSKRWTTVIFIDPPVEVEI